MCVFLISPVPIAEPLTSELIDTPVFHNLAPGPIKYRVSVPIPIHHAKICIFEAEPFIQRECQLKMNKALKLSSFKMDTRSLKS